MLFIFLVISCRKENNFDIGGSLWLSACVEEKHGIKAFFRTKRFSDFDLFYIVGGGVI